MASWSKLLKTAEEAAGKKVEQEAFHDFAKSDFAKGLFKTDENGAHILSDNGSYLFNSKYGHKDLKTKFSEFQKASDISGGADAGFDGMKRLREIEQNAAASSKSRIGSDDKFKFKRFEGKAKNFNLKNPISPEFEQAFAKEYENVTGESGFKFKGANQEMSSNMRKTLGNMTESGKFDKDIERMFKGAKNLQNDSAAFRQAVRDKRVEFDKKPGAFSQKMDAFLKQAVPITVGGGLIFSMFNRGGQMSNSELYGQRQQYGM